MVTIMEVFEARRAAKGLPRQDSYSAQEFADQGLGMIGGCLSCEATLSADHAYPDRRGYWACEGCLSDGYETVEAFEAAETESVDDDQDDPGDTWFCESCGGDVYSLGVLGRAEHGRCRGCGLSSRREANP